MRVAFTMTRASDVGGVERQAHSIAQALLDAGHEVHVFAHEKDANVDPRLVFHRIPKAPSFLRATKVWLFDRACERAIAREGPFDVVQGFGKTSRQDVYFDGSGCLADYQRYSIDHQTKGFRAFLRRASPHQRVVADIERRRFTRGNFRHVLAISEFVRRQILDRYGLDPAEVETLHPGVDLERFRPLSDAERASVRSELGVGAETPLLSFLGSDYRRKGLATFLEVLSQWPEAHGLVIGREKPARERAFRRRAEELGVLSRTHFLGVQEDPGRWLAASDCFLFPTLFDAFGSAVIEALACGTPAVVSRVSGAAELVADGKAGRVVDDPEDAGAFLLGAKELLDLERREERAALARAEAERRPWSRHVDRVLAVYEDLVRPQA